MMGNQPVIILKEGTKRERGRGAQSNNILAAKAVAEAVRTTLGPKGMDKMLVDSMGDVVITNDGATILKEIDVEHPTAKMIIEVSKTQEQECGDGTTSAVVLAGELLKKAEDLIEDVHPTLITQGYRLASDKAVETLEGLAQSVDIKDTKTLERIARTSLASKGSAPFAELLAQIAVKAVAAVSDESGGKWTVDKDNIKIEKKKGGSVSDTELIQGVVLDKERVHTRMPKAVESPKIALVSAALEIKKTEVEAKIEITDPSQLQAFLDEEEHTIRRLVDQVKGSGANVLFCQKSIDDLAAHYLAKEGIYAVKNVSEKDMNKLARATGGKVVTNLKDLTREDLGKAGTVEERKIGEDALTFVSGAKGAKAVTILVRGGSEHVIDEVERNLDDAIGVVATAIRYGKIVAGAGAPEIEVALALRKYAASVGGREQLAIEAFADAVEIIPRTLAENAGLDAINVLVDLRSAHEKGQKFAGIDLDSGKVVDSWKANVLEPVRVKTQAVQSATEVATMILRIDDIIAAKHFEPGKGGEAGGHGGPGGMDF
ncbi:MAG TPA: thermosome subunit beta [Candidatus Thermoplasmatota archaeon]|nr:thermosome subunit beta [Candidatus Thermoplasmatota archaeon]